MNKKVAILGAGLGGLSAAVHAAAKGFDVSVYEKGSTYGGKAEKIVQDGFILDPGPSIVILLQIYRDIFKSVGEEFEKYLTLKRLDPIFELRHRARKVEIPADISNFLDFIKSEFPEDEKGIKKLLNYGKLINSFARNTIFKKPIQTVFDLISPSLLPLTLKYELLQPYKKIIDRHISTPILKAFFYTFPNYSGKTYNDPSPESFMILHSMLSDGVYYPEGGISKITEAFYTIAKQKGVAFHFNHNLDSLNFNEKRVKSAKFTNGVEIVADHFISNIDKLYIEKLLSREQANLEPNLSYYTLHLTYNKPLEWRNHHISLMPDNYDEYFESLYNKQDLPLNPALYVNAPSIIDQTIVPKGKSSIFIVMTTPSQATKLNWSEIEKSSLDIVLRALNQHGLPLERSEISSIRIQTPQYFMKKHNNFEGSLYGSMPKHWPIFNLFPSSNFDTHLQNLTYCGATVQPGAGLPMVALSGKFATSHL